MDINEQVCILYVWSIKKRGGTDEDGAWTKFLCVMCEITGFVLVNQIQGLRDTM